MLLIKILSFILNKVKEIENFYFSNCNWTVNVLNTTVLNLINKIVIFLAIFYICMLNMDQNFNYPKYLYFLSFKNVIQNK